MSWLYDFFDDSILLEYFSPEKRVRQVRVLLLISALTLMLLFIWNFIANPDDRVSISLFLSFIFAIFLFFFAGEDTYSISAGMFLWWSAISIAHSAWTHSGLWDASLFAYPCILTLAIVFNMQAIFIAVYALNIACILFLSYAHTNYIIDTEPFFYQWIQVRAINYIVLISVFCFFLQIMFGDFKSLLQRLLLENRRTQDNQEEITKLANFDPVTGLPNERVCGNNFDDCLTLYQAEGGFFGAVSVDVGNFDSISSAVEDAVSVRIIKKISVRLLSLEKAGVLLHHLRGGKFLFLILTDSVREVESLAERAIFAISHPMDVSGYHLEPKGLAGLSLITPENNVVFSVLVQQCMLALFTAKKNDSLDPVFFDPVMVEESESRRLTLNALRQAIKKEEFELYYQPKIELKSGRVVGAEALIRWNRPGIGLVFPDHFIPLAEESGMIVEIGDWVIKKACSDCKQWHILGFDKVGLAVNLSMAQFTSGNLASHIFKALKAVELPAHALELELTESMLIEDILHIQAQIHEISAKGVLFSIDDFGTGYSNLGYISQFNVSFLKIDRYFVGAMLQSEAEQHIVKAVVQLSDGLGLSTIAEGVEDAETVAALVQLGCQYGQGYYWSKPIPNNAFIEYLHLQEGGLSFDR